LNIASMSGTAETLGLGGRFGPAGNVQGANAPSPKLVQAAHEFEGQMMKELLKPMTGGDALTGVENGSDSGTGSGGALGEFASEALGQALSSRGGFGIADRIVGVLSHSSNQHENGKVTANLHNNTVMRASE
jgi:Rod binding domain-containing protein